MGVSDTVSFGIEGVIGIFIFIVFFASVAPSIVDYVNNYSASIGMPSTVILVLLLFPLLFVLGIFMKLWKKLTNPDQPQTNYGGGFQ